MKNIGNFYLKIFSFLEVKFSIYLNRRVFVMVSPVIVIPVYLQFAWYFLANNLNSYDPI